MRTRSAVSCLAWRLAISAPALAAATGAQAAAPTAAERLVYDPAFFAAGRPNTAYDMILLLPGFAFDPGQEARGYASAAGNVLVDGKRPVTKLDTLVDVLSRIPAASVLRVEVIRGGASGVDMQGRTVLANIVRRGSATEITNTSDMLWTADGRVGLTTRFDAARRDGQVGLEGSLYLFHHDGDLAGDGQKVRRDNQGATLSVIDERFVNPVSGVKASGQYQRPAIGGLLSLKGSAVYGTNLLAEGDLVQDAAGRRDELVLSVFRTRHGEVSAEYTRRQTPDLELTLTGLQNLEKAENADHALQSGVVINERDSGLQGESILRAKLRYGFGPRWSFEAGGEGAYNFLDQTTVLTVGGVGQALPSADVHVAETRAEAFATLSWRPSAQLAIEAASRVEVSRLTVSGDAHNSVSLTFPKPRLVVTWSPTPTDQLRLRAERVVGQLNFQDFVTSSSFDQGVISAGNPTLEPERDWIVEMAWERRIGDGSVVLTANHAELEKVVDVVPFHGFSAPGNIGAGRRDTLSVNLNAPLTLVGFPRARLKAQGTWLRSAVTDPTTGARRRITNDQPFAGSLSLNNDVPRLRSAWRIDVTAGYRYAVYRIDEVQNLRYETQVDALWEYKPDSKVSFQAQLQNITGRRRLRDREIFSGLRNAGGLAAVESREVRNGPRLYLQVRRGF
jgi:outer membrane receptor protein involved in Fe transport